MAVLISGCTVSKTNRIKGDNNLKPENIMNIMHKVADWQIAKLQSPEKASNDWTYATLYAGLFDFGKLSKDKKYVRFLYNVGQELDWNTGKIRFHADEYCIGQTYCELYEIYHEPNIIGKFHALADSIVAKPHIESLEFKNNINSREWAWCDALFMGPPALAYLSTATHDPKYLETADKLWWKTTDYLFDTTEGLYYRDSRYFTKREANGQKVFWSRGNGWVMGGLVRMMINMPANYPNKQKFEALFKIMAKRIASLQTSDGTWHASLLAPELYPSKETSGTGFYCYALAWGIRNGLLPYKEYFPIVKKSWDVLVASVHPDGKLGFVQQIEDKPGDVKYDDTQVYGVGAFLLAGTQLFLLLNDIKN